MPPDPHGGVCHCFSDANCTGANGNYYFRGSFVYYHSKSVLISNFLMNNI